MDLRDGHLSPSLFLDDWGNSVGKDGTTISTLQYWNHNGFSSSNGSCFLPIWLMVANGPKWLKWFLGELTIRSKTIGILPWRKKSQIWWWLLEVQILIFRTLANTKQYFVKRIETRAFYWYGKRVNGGNL